MIPARHLALVLFILLGTASVADEPVRSLEEADEQYSQARKRLIADNLQLTAEEARAFWPVYAQFEKDLLVITEQRRAIIARFGENYDSMSDEIARQLITDRLRMEESRARIRKKFLPRFEKVLPIKKLARYYQIESKISATVEAGIAEELPLLK